MTSRTWAASALVTSLASSALAQETTTVRLTDTVLLPDASRIGYNISGDNYYSPPALKRRLALSFEGGSSPASRCGTPRPASQGTGSPRA